MQGVPVSWHADPYSSSGVAYDSALLAFFYVGVDIIDLFPMAVGSNRFLYVTTDMFTKWPKAASMATINKASTMKILKSIVCRFGFPNRIIFGHRS
jgi:hypothetical protein